MELENTVFGTAAWHVRLVVPLSSFLLVLSCLRLQSSRHDPLQGILQDLLNAHL